jgi:hypothetical protein
MRLHPDQQALSDLMSDMSERAWCAGWMDGLEYALWEAVIGRRKTYGLLTFTELEVQQLRSLADKCGGWIVWSDDAAERKWVAMEIWLGLFQTEYKPSPEIEAG